MGPTIETARLILRPPVQADHDGFAAMAQEEDTMRFIGGTSSREVAWRVMATITGAWSLLGYSMFSVIEKESGQWIGRLGPWQPGGPGGTWPGTEVGWALLSRSQGRGYATEGARAAIDWAFETLGWESVVHCIDPRNIGSLAVARRLGSSLLRTGVRMPPPNVDVWVDLYGQTRAAWKSRITD